MKYILILLNRATGKYILLPLWDREGKKCYYTFDFGGVYEVIADLLGGSGEGEYFVCTPKTTSLEDAEVLDCGVLQVGEIVREEAEAYGAEKTYTQYGG